MLNLIGGQMEELEKTTIYKKSEKIVCIQKTTLSTLKHLFFLKIICMKFSKTKEKKNYKK